MEHVEFAASFSVPFLSSCCPCIACVSTRRCQRLSQLSSINQINDDSNLTAARSPPRTWWVICMDTVIQMNTIQCVPPLQDVSVSDVPLQLLWNRHEEVHRWDGSPSHTSCCSLFRCHANTLYNSHRLIHWLVQYVWLETNRETFYFCLSMCC